MLNLHHFRRKNKNTKNLIYTKLCVKILILLNLYSELLFYIFKYKFRFLFKEF